MEGNGIEVVEETEVINAALYQIQRYTSLKHQVGRRIIETRTINSMKETINVILSFQKFWQRKRYTLGQLLKTKVGMTISAGAVVCNSENLNDGHLIVF